jgi:glycerol uptake facilitator-like aquaporin
MSPTRRYAAEGIGTAFLLVAIVGSGIMGERLAEGNEAIALLANSIATGGALFVLLLALGPVSGAHLNPIVSMVLAARGDISASDIPGYVLAQFVGAIAGVWATHAMFNMQIVEVATKARPGFSLMWSEFIATMGLLSVVLLISRSRPTAIAPAVAAYILAAYWFTSSTSFANPAVTVARSLTDSFTGIAPTNVLGFLVAQALAGGALFAYYRVKTISE